ncbi:MAG: hypothetical protein N2593_00030 [Patescibacteria group bacterium]|nr:hypothetical protein [Patescibacteria group bacterium]
MRTEIYFLMDPSVAENSPAIQELLRQFQSMLPSHFGKAYFVPAPPILSLQSVLRANCQNKNCSVRAVVHIERGNDSVLKIVEEKPNFSRLNNVCKKCKDFLNIK